MSFIKEKYIYLLVISAGLIYIAYQQNKIKRLEQNIVDIYENGNLMNEISSLLVGLTDDQVLIEIKNNSFFPTIRANDFSPSLNENIDAQISLSINNIGLYTPEIYICDSLDSASNMIGNITKINKEGQFQAYFNIDTHEAGIKNIYGHYILKSNKKGPLKDFILPFQSQFVIGQD